MDTPLAPPQPTLARASPSARKSGKDLVKLDCMRGVVGGDLFEHQRALTVVKVFLCKSAGVGERIEQDRDRGDRRKKMSFTFLSIWGCHWARRWPGCQYVLGIRVRFSHLPSAKLKIVWYFLFNCWNLPKSIRSPSRSFQSGIVGSYRLLIFAHLLISESKSIAE